MALFHCLLLLQLFQILGQSFDQCNFYRLNHLFFIGARLFMKWPFEFLLVRVENPGNLIKLYTDGHLWVYHLRSPSKVLQISRVCYLLSIFVILQNISAPQKTTGPRTGPSDGPRSLSASGRPRGARSLSTSQAPAAGSIGRGSTWPWLLEAWRSYIDWARDCGRWRVTIASIPRFLTDLWRLQVCFTSCPRSSISFPSHSKFWTVEVLTLSL